MPGRRAHYKNNDKNIKLIFRPGTPKFEKLKLFNKSTHNNLNLVKGQAVVVTLI